MSHAPTASDLLRSIGLDVDGPGRWGERPASRAPGVFVVETPTPSETAPIDIDAVRRWLERVPSLRLDGDRPTQTTLTARMAEFWLPGQSILYVGRTAKSLGARVASLYATELGHARPHPGGHWLKTLRDQGRLRLWWAETEAAEEYEDELIEAFGRAIPREARGRLPEGAPPLPWASLASPTGPERQTGITDFLLSAEATPTRASSVKRSDSTGRRRMSRSAPAATRSSRRPSTRTEPGGAATAPPAKEAPTHLTAEGLVALKDELERLRSVERPQVVERVKHARELGDLRENAEYHAARNEQSFLEGRIQQLERQLRTAVVIESSAGGAVAMGSTVRFEVEGQPGEVTIVGSTESDPASGRISAVSPVGKALLGRRVGDDVVVTTPAAEIHYRITGVS